MTRELPRQFVEMLEAFASRDFEQLAEALATTEPEVSVRLNRRRGGSQIPSLLSEVVDTPVTWTDGGYYLSSRPRFTLDPALHQGRYYVQDASSMFISRAVAEALRHLDLSRQLLYIDACAAPGGKTTAAINVLPDGTTLIANEFVPLRAAVLHENITKWGYPDVIVTRGDTAAIGDALTGMADIIAADVPCSGEGMMRKDPEAIVQWSPKLVNDSARLQREIITNLWPALKPGGFFIYSTCTFNRRENEDNLEW
ncbi:MAG: RsmB/NOP family class I SAM-dependent RNA methyltransferase, partial [Muribaculaceae bacterium]|nr:RsmB/NOP family class I SAM-dependent RNA methyltransferase [Muribaculaceae bacterium]